MSYDIIVQARYGSSRFPGKILYNFSNISFLDFLISNLKKTKKIRYIILATPSGRANMVFKTIAKKNKISFFSSTKIKEEDLVSRYFFCAKFFKSENIIRITSDCPFTNPIIVEKMIDYYKKNNLEFLTNNKPKFIPQGFDCEIISYELLKKVYKLSKTKFDREHVTPWIRRNYFSKKNNLKIFKKNYSKLRLTLDYPSDFLFFCSNEKNLKKVSTKSNIEYYLNKLLKK